VNSTGHDRSEVVELPDGRFAQVHVPACGYATSGLEPLGLGHERVEATERHLENTLLRVEWDGEGRLTRVYDKEAGREVLQPGSPGNVLRLHPDHPALWDAWDLDPSYQETWTEVGGLRELRVVQSEGVRGAVEMTRTFGASSLA